MLHFLFDAQETLLFSMLKTVVVFYISQDSLMNKKFKRTALYIIIVFTATFDPFIAFILGKINKKSY